MKLTYNNTDYWVSWQHENNENYRCTDCIITIQGFHKVAQGTTKCSVKDRFVKETGRKISFKRALTNLFPNDKEARTCFWNAYLNRK